MQKMTEKFWGDAASIRRIIAANAFWRFASTGVSRGLRFVIFFLAARWLGPSGFGEYNYAVSLASLAFIFSDWGVNALLVRNLNQENNENHVISTSLAAKLIANAASIAIALVLFALIDGGRFFSLGVLLSVFFLFSNLRELYINFFIARKNNKLEFGSMVVEIVASLILLYAFRHSLTDPVRFAAFNIAVTFCTLAFTAYIAKKALSFRSVPVSWKDIKALLIAGLPLALFGISGYIFFASDQVLLKYYLGFAAVGYYSLAARAITAAQIVPGILVSVAFPFLAKFVVSEHGRFRKLFFVCLWGIAAVGAAAAVAITVLAKPLLELLAPQYLLAVPIMQLMSVSLVATYVSVLLDNTLLALNKQKQNLYITLACAVFNLLLNIYAIPHYGVYGAVYATIISQFANMAFTGGYVLFSIKKRGQHADSIV